MSPQINKIVCSQLEICSVFNGFDGSGSVSFDTGTDTDLQPNF